MAEIVPGRRNASGCLRASSTATASQFYTMLPEAKAKATWGAISVLHG